MFILDKPRIFNGSSISVPLYHRGHLSLLSNANIWLCFLPGNEQNNILPEIVISPINFSHWRDLWHISVTVRDAVGVVNRIFEVLKDRKLNVIVAESSCMERQSLHTVEIIVDAADYSNAEDGTHQERVRGGITRLHSLEKDILVYSMDVMSFLTSENKVEPRLRIRRVRNLYEAAEGYYQANEAWLKNENQSKAPKPLIETAVVAQADPGNANKFNIEIPRDIRTNLALALNSSPEIKSRAQFLMVSETRDRFLRVYFMHEADAIVHASLSYVDEIGALAAITRPLRGDHFNILTSLVRLHQHQKSAECELVLQYRGADKHMSKATLRKKLEETLGTHDLVSTYKAKISYPSSYLKRPEPKELTGTYDLPSPSINTNFATVSDLFEEYRKKINDPYVTKEEQWKIDFIRNLYNLMHAANPALGSQIVEPRDVFVSFNFSESAIIAKVRELAEHEPFDFQVVTAEEIHGAPNIREGIIEKMKQCTHFLGVWSEGGGYQQNNYWWPSPWMLWELGCGQALGLNCRLLVSEKIHVETWKKVAPDIPHVMYTTGNFDTQLRLALKALYDMPIKKT